MLLYNSLSINMYTLIVILKNPCWHLWKSRQCLDQPDICSNKSRSKEVSRGAHENFKGDSWMFHWHLKQISWKFEVVKNVSRMFLGSFKSVFKVFQRWFKEFSRKYVAWHCFLCQTPNAIDFQNLDQNFNIKKDEIR